MPERMRAELSMPFGTMMQAEDLLRGIADCDSEHHSVGTSEVEPGHHLPWREVKQSAAQSVLPYVLQQQVPSDLP